MKKEKVIISSLIPTVLDSYTIGTGITAQNKSIKRKCMILVRPYRCSLSGNINRIGSISETPKLYAKFVMKFLKDCKN